MVYMSYIIIGILVAFTPVIIGRIIHIITSQNYNIINYINNIFVRGIFIGIGGMILSKGIIL